MNPTDFLYLSISTNNDESIKEKNLEKVEEWGNKSHCTLFYLCQLNLREFLVPSLHAIFYN